MKSRLKVIILDFDGVLIESNEIKDRAFGVVFAGFPEKLEEIMAYHRSVQVIRFEKFRYIYEKILRLPYTDDVAKNCARVFSEYSVSESIRCPWVRGAEDFLKTFYGQLPMYLVSVNPPEDLKMVLEGRRAAHFFKYVHTVTSSKTSALKDILKRESAGCEQAVFIGDSISDYNSAFEAGVPFVGRRSQFELDGITAPIFENMKDVAEFLKKERM